ncbi:MAG: 5-deoxy-glucuronate isomerase [Chloroflexi bacterium]|nr:5-deoxy-glucuronate isomerase [Chloroflexota bacterium]MCI0578006.1 5-deoxy-glucuronate isomerase [Chloroflexota bacterium]MCI0646704.1 5-deoxy-glucuronate isomerase [Chloroflexota bacterium]MCI0726105.1 5-deoxy-glucuronate isomerase [Chloroflexota bacterium]
MESHLLVHSVAERGEYVRVTPETAGWEWLSFAARKMAQGEQWRQETGNDEYAIVVLGGVCSVRSSRGEWNHIGRRPNVFSGMPYALYLPRQTTFTLEAVSDELDVACGWCAAAGDHPAQLVRPEQATVEIRGGGNATRQINNIVPPGFNCHRLVAVEVYTPSGNWSSYPPHKHDVHREDAAGNVLEADLEEIYFYKLDRPGGYAYQRVYTADGRLDELVMARNNDIVLVPEGYHPVVSAHGYTTYYLNFLAGSAQSLANSDDPAYAWVKATWQEKDPRLPVVTLEMEGSKGQVAGGK